jgi:hypothetical protein
MQGASGNWYLHWARRHGGQRLFGPHIPRHILIWAGVDETELDRGGGPWLVSRSTRNVLERPEPFISDTILEMKRARRAWFTEQDTREIRLIKARIPTPITRHTPPMLDIENAQVIYLGDAEIYYGSVRQGNHYWAIVTMDSEHMSDRVFARRFRTRRQADAAAETAARDAAADAETPDDNI